jgi:prepilin-type N-terminal cleavage/methylation domain-containing protein
MKFLNKNSGFTLVELAIVMVVIGLIVSGVLVGQQLIEQARIRKVLTQLTQYDQALSTFRLKYDYLPGDFPQAYRFFGSFSSCTDEVSANIAGTGCNGNGNGAIGGSNASASEVFLAWAHLSRAALIAGTYTGFPINIDMFSSANNIIFQGGKNFPWIGAHQAMIMAGTENGRLVYIMSANPDSNGDSTPGFSINEAYTIDSKRDDGNPSTGTVLALNVNDYADCFTAGAYNIGTAGVLCILTVFAQ